MITKKYYKLIRVSYADSGYFYLHNETNNIVDFKIERGGSWVDLNYDFKYSLDGVNWNTYTVVNYGDTPNVVNLPANGNIYLKGLNTNGFINKNIKDYGQAIYISLSDDYSVGGNILSLCYDDNFTTTTPTNLYFYRGIFGGKLISAANLILPNSLFNSNNILGLLFYRCSYLITPPDLSNLTTVNCTLPTGWGSQDPVTGLFSGCTSLSSVANLSNLTSSNKTFNGMYQNCSSLTVGEDLRNFTTDTSSIAFTLFYSGCSNLSTVYAPNISTWNTNTFDHWMELAGTSATGTKTMYCPAGVTIPTDSVSGIPTGWVRVDY